MRAHWPEYAIEAAGLGLFMVVACVLGTALGHPAALLVAAIPDPVARRALMGLAMGATAVALIYSPWGRRSGAHFNPATTLAFWWLGKVRGPDAVAYTGAQALGGLAGVTVARAVLGPPLAHPDVQYVVTAPGAAGVAAAFIAELVMAFVLMSVVLRLSNTAALAPLTGLAAGALVAVYILVEAPVSGMSMNPARSLASAVPSRAWHAFWIYVAAPPLGMVAAAALHARRRAVYCAKLRHDAGPCIFRCRAAELRHAPPTVPAVSQQQTGQLAR